MIEFMRRISSGLVAKLLIALLVVSFSVWGIAGIFSGTGKDIGIRVGKTELATAQVVQILRNQIRILSQKLNRPLTIGEAWSLGIVDQLIQQLAMNATLVNAFKERNLGITDSVVAQKIIEDPQFRGATGSFDHKYFKKILNANGISEQEYLAHRKEIHLIQQVSKLLETRFLVPDPILKAWHSFANQQRTIAHISVTSDMLDEIETPDPAVLEEFFTLRKEQYYTPEYRKIALLQILPQRLSDSIEISEEQIRKEYETRKENFSQKEHREVEQILFDTLAEAKESSDQIKSGLLSFQELARKRNLTPEDLKLGTLEQKNFLDPVVGTTAFSLKDGEVSEPIKGHFGVALLRIAKIIPEKIRTFEEVSGSLRAKLKLQAARNLVLDLRDRVEDERIAGTPFQEIAEKLSLSYQTLDTVDIQGRDAQGKPLLILPKYADVLEIAFQIEQGTEVDPVALSDGELVWMDLLEVIPPKAQEFHEVRDKITAAWREEETRKQLAFKTQELLVELESGVPFSSVAANLGVTVKVAADLKRSSKVEGFSSSMLETMFMKPLHAFGFAEDSEGLTRILFQVRKIEQPPFDKALFSDMEQEISEAMAGDLLQTYLMALQSEFGLYINRNRLLQTLR